MAKIERAPWLMVLAAFLAASSVFAASIRVPVEGGMLAALTDQQKLFLEVSPRRGEGLLAFSQRLTGSTRHARRISSENGNPKRLLTASRYRIPFSLLSDSLKLQVIKAVFPEDRLLKDGWRHRVGRKTRGQTLWHIAEWFTGRGESYKAIRKHNRLPNNTIHPGQALVIPKALLVPAFLDVGEDAPPPPRVAAQPPPKSEPSAGEKRAANDEPEIRVPSIPAPSVPTTSPSTEAQASAPKPAAAKTEAPSLPRIRIPTPGVADLRYESLPGGDYAIYRLAKGEALYSSVVVRFTGRTFAEDVNSLAAEIAKLNGIRDVTNIPVGRRIQIPLEQLQPEYLPPGHPGRVEYEKARKESAQFSNTVRVSRLEGITVILDAGHGGNDPGASRGSTWESVYVYDIMIRVKRLLEQSTGAKVVPTVRDGREFRVSERDLLPRSRGHAVLTSPHYPIEDPKVATNLRWYLANSALSQAVAREGDDRKVVFLSIHADSLHPSLRGAMAYIPSTSLTKGEYGKTGAVYSSRREVRQQPRVNFSWKQRARSEGLSRQLANSLIAQFRRKGLAVHPQKAIRDRVVRNRRWTYVPAVIRYNAVPAKVLFEVANLNNLQDRRLLQTSAFRQKVAQALVDGIIDYYRQEGSGSSQVARKAQ